MDDRLRYELKIERFGPDYGWLSERYRWVPNPSASACNRGPTRQWELVELAQFLGMSMHDLNDALAAQAVRMARGELDRDGLGRVTALANGVAVE